MSPSAHKRRRRSTGSPVRETRSSIESLRAGLCSIVRWPDGDMIGSEWRPVKVVLSARASRALDARGPGSDLRELARLDQLHQQVPLIPLEHREVARLADAHLLGRNLDVGAVATTRGTQRDLDVLHTYSPPSLHE